METYDGQEQNSLKQEKVDKTDVVRLKISKLKDLFARLRQLYDVSLASTDGKTIVLAQIKDITQQTTILTRDIHSYLKVWKDSNATDRLQQARASQMFRDVIVEFQEVQGQYKLRCRRRFEKYFKVTFPYASEEEINQAWYKVEDSVSYPPNTESIGVEVHPTDFSPLTRVPSPKKRVLMQMQQEKDFMVKMEDSVQNLQQLYLDVTALCDAHSQDIDTVESQVHDAHEDMDKGAKELEKGAYIAKLSRHKKILILFCSLMVLIGIGILVYIYGFRAASVSENTENSNSS